MGMIGPTWTAAEWQAGQTRCARSPAGDSIISWERVSTTVPGTG